MKITRVLRRETDCFERGLPIVIEIHPRSVEMWLKGERRRSSFSWSALYWMAAKSEADAVRVEKLKAKRRRS